MTIVPQQASSKTTILESRRALRVEVIRMCMVDDAEPFAVMLNKWRACRKPFKCCECYREVSVGERYWWTKALWESQWEEYKMCAHCRTFAAGWLLAQCSGYLFHGVQEDLEDHRHEVYELDLSLGRAIVGMRRKWRKKDGSLMPVPA